MKKRSLCILIMLSLLVVLSACSTEQQEESREASGESSLGHEGNLSGNEGEESQSPEYVESIKRIVEVPEGAYYFEPLQTYLYKDAVIYKYEADSEEDSETILQEAVLQMGHDLMKELCEKPYTAPADGQYSRRLEDYKITEYKDLTLHSLVRTTSEEYNETYSGAYIDRGAWGITRAGNIWALDYDVWIKGEGDYANLLAEDWKENWINAGETELFQYGYCVAAKEGNTYYMVRTYDIAERKEAYYFEPLGAFLYEDAVVHEYESPYGDNEERYVKNAGLQLGRILMQELCVGQYIGPKDGQCSHRTEDYRITEYKDIAIRNFVQATSEEYDKTYGQLGITPAENIWILDYDVWIRGEGEYGNLTADDWKEQWVSGEEAGVFDDNFCIMAKVDKKYYLVRSYDVAE